MLGGQTRRVSIAEGLDRVNRELRRPFIDLIGSFSVKNSSPLWWSTELAARNPYTLSLFLHICFLKVGAKLLDGIEEDFLIVVESSGVLRQLRRIARGKGIVTKDVSPRRPLQCRLRWLTSGLKGRCRYWIDFARRRKKLRQLGPFFPAPFSGDDTALFFTWVDGRNFAPSGGYIDPHFGPLPDHARKRGHRVAYLARMLNTASFGEDVERLRRTGETFFFPEAILSWKDLAYAAVQTFFYRPALPARVLLEGLDVYNLVREQVRQERMSAAHPMMLVYYALIRRLAKRGVRPRTIFYTFEGHSWENAVCLGVRAYMPDTELVAFENVIFTKMLMGAFPSRQEWNCRPMPDRIVTNGSLFSRVLLEEGYPAEKVVEGAALRHHHLWRLQPAPARREVRGPVNVLVATSIGFSDSVDLIEKALRAFEGRPGYQVFIKCHPALNREFLGRAVGDLNRISNVKFVDSPVGEWLAQAHVLLYTYTSVCFEALAHGVPPVFVRSENWLNMDQLDAAPDCHWTVTRPEEILKVTEEIINMSDEAWRTWCQKAREVMAKGLAPVTTERLDRFLQRA
jgi:surface carbohydrate biosynthesis protein (TIGR04326 family)